MTNIEGVHQALDHALAKRGYTELTPVQNAVLQPELSNADALVSAQTGSGKTVAFGLAMASTLLGDQEKFGRAQKPQALIVAPTRELALQVKRELEWLYESTGALIASCVGGMDMRTERRTLDRGAHIVVGTPGRLRDHIMRKSLDPSQLKVVVLDEADEMLDLGFKEDLEFILETTPEERRTLLFSATVPPMIAKLAKSYQRDAVRVQTAQEQKQHVDIQYRALATAPRERENAIINVLRYYEAKNALVFCNTRATVNHMVSRFNNRGFSVVALSGELSQNERTHALQAMRDGRARVCIATDVAARGIDLPNLELVIHADLPSNPETLLHRSGRTGRAGRKGVSALMVENKTRKKAERLLRFAKINAEWAAPPSADEVNKRDEERILLDPILSDAVTDDEREFVETLLTKHSPEQLAAAFIRQNRAGKSAPEDLQSVRVHAPEPGAHGKHSDRDSPRKPREDFKNSTWFSLSVGRKQNAEPRWLIPLLCNAGDISKAEIGVIKMQNDETWVQINADNAADFVEALGPNQVLEKNIRVTQLDKAPSGASQPHQKPTGKKHHRKKGGFDDQPKKPHPPRSKGKKPYVAKSPKDKPPHKANQDSNTSGGEQKTKSPHKSGKPGQSKEGWAKKKPRPGFKGKRADASNPKKKKLKPKVKASN